MMKILILEDEIPAYEKLIANLKLVLNQDYTQDWSRSIKEGKKLIENNSYELILSDIQLLDGISFDLFENNKIDCPIIFCSAHDDYLFEAFKTNGIAYILKPYSENDFCEALQKYESLFSKHIPSSLSQSTIQELKLALNTDRNSYKNRFVVKRPSGIQILQVDNIVLIQASGDFTIAFDTNGEKFPLSKNIGSIELEISPEQFFKVNRSQIIQLNHISSIEKYSKNRLKIFLKGNKEEVMTTSNITADFRKWLDN